MKKIIKLSAIFSFLIFFSSNIFAADGANKIRNLTIFSENNMTYPLVKIARIYSEQKHSIVSINFDHSFQLIKNINDGEPADVFISSHHDWIETLKQQGLVDVYNLVNVAKDKLLLITSKKNHKLDLTKISGLNDIKAILTTLSHQDIPLIVDSKNTSLGKYTDTILSEAKVANQKIIHHAIEDKKSITDLVNDGDDYCGIVLASSIKNYNNIAVVKEIENSEIYYQALVIAGDNMEKARDFLKFIKSDEMKRVFLESGFIVD